MSLTVTVYFFGRPPISLPLDAGQAHDLAVCWLTGWTDADAEKAPDGELEGDLQLYLGNACVQAAAEAGEFLPSEIESINRHAGSIKRVDIVRAAAA